MALALSGITTYLVDADGNAEALSYHLRLEKVHTTMIGLLRRELASKQGHAMSLGGRWTLRLLQLFWPDPLPREAFQEQAQNWQDGKSEGLSILHQGLLLSIQQSPLSFARRTVLEFVFPGEEGLAW